MTITTKLFVLVPFLFVLGTGCEFPRANPPIIPSQPVACTAEAKQCPDGSYVGRVGPNCEFAACPSPAPTPKKTGCSATDKSCPTGYTCIQECGPPVVREGDAPPPYYCATNAEASKPRNCPICLASNTMIATPNGDVNVKDVRVGMKVWSRSKEGKKVASIVLRVTKTPVPSSHKVVHLVLADKREVWVSPNHPTIGTKLVGELRRGDLYDGSTVQSAERISYWDTATYDLLPDSDTGEYWADGILLGSTLSRR
ncbi:MAG: Hint domain-containing protein [Patescibacteria group bacterium]